MKLITFYQADGQIEILPRITILYHDDMHKGVAFEFLWWGLFLRMRSYKPKTTSL